MKTWKIARIAEIDISVHWSFLLLIAWVAIPALGGGTLATAAASRLVLLTAVFGCVVLHELGHALAARQFGIATRGITLLPIGGVANLERIPRKPLQELWIALAGPLVNVAIAVGILLILPVLHLLWPIHWLTGGLLTLLDQLFWVNVALVVFNLLPAFPMDGGRVLRACLALVMPYVDATRRAASVGKVMAILLAVVGLFINPMLILVAGFVYLAGSAEANMVAATSPAARRKSDTADGPVYPVRPPAGIYVVNGPPTNRFVADW